MTYSQFFEACVSTLATLDNESDKFSSKMIIYKQHRGRTYKFEREFNFVKEDSIWKVRYYTGGFMGGFHNKEIDKYRKDNLWRLDQNDSGISV